MRECLYLLRFDDICPTMAWANWDPVEQCLLSLGVRPILAVVPDNRDPHLAAGPPREDFWDRVRRWQARGWTIAMHGYQHVYVTRDAGLIGLNARSEFAGLSRTEQERKLAAGLAIFRQHRVRADAWVAPGHSFDRTTVDLLTRLGLPVISDGLGRRPYSEPGGAVWVPQQVWDFCPRPPGIWTVCCHPNAWSQDQLERFLGSLEAYAARITSLPQVLERYAGRPLSLADRIAAWHELRWTRGLRPWLSRTLKGGRSMEGRIA